VNEVNGGAIFLYDCVSVCAQQSGQSDSWSITKTVKATDFKFITSVSMVSPDMTS